MFRSYPSHELSWGIFVLYEFLLEHIFMSARLFLFVCYFHFNPNNVFVMNKSASDIPQSMSEIIDECLSA